MQTGIYEVFRKSASVARIVIFSFAARLRSLLAAFSCLTIKQTLFSHCVRRNNHSFAQKFQPGTDRTTTQPSLYLHIHVMYVPVPEPFVNQSLNQWIEHFFFTFFPFDRKLSNFGVYAQAKRNNFDFEPL